MKELLKFQDWAIEKGHYQTVTSLKSYFKLLENRLEGTNNTSKDYQILGEERSRSDKPDNS